jgi:hypothetical protein
MYLFVKRISNCRSQRGRPAGGVEESQEETGHAEATSRRNVCVSEWQVCSYFSGLLAADTIISIETMAIKMEEGWDHIRAAGYA